MDIQKKLNIEKGDLVLEVGSGGEPYWRSDILLDKYFIDHDGYRNLGSLFIDDRIMIIADALTMPFRDKSVDYIICNHVVEHVEEIEKLFKEFERVANKGFIGCPTEIYDKIYDPPTHIWFIENINNKLYFRKKNEKNFKPNYFGRFFPMLYRVRLKNNSMRLMFKQFRNLFFIEYEWMNKIDYEIIKSDDGLLNYADKDEILEYIKKNTNYRINKMINEQNIPHKFIKIAKKLLLIPIQKSKFNNCKLEEILMCPKCKGNLSVTNERVYCLQCSKEYKKKNNIIFFSDI